MTATISTRPVAPGARPSPVPRSAVSVVPLERRLPHEAPVRRMVGPWMEHLMAHGFSPADLHPVRARIWLEEGDPTEDGQAVLDLAALLGGGTTLGWRWWVDVHYDGVRHRTLRRALPAHADTGWLAIDRPCPRSGDWREAIRVTSHQAHSRLASLSDGHLRVRHARYRGGRLEVHGVGVTLPSAVRPG